MRKKLVCVVVIFIYLLPGVDLMATHIVGGEVTYECKGSDPNNPDNWIYTITMNIYRDCLGGQVGFDSAPLSRQLASITVFGGAPDYAYVNSLYLAAPLVSPVLPVNSSCVISPPNICVEQGVYVYDLSLPLSDESYYIVYQRCCRNESISNISDPGNAGATFHIALTKRAQEECNSSPVFTNTPSAFACVNTTMNYDNSAFDADGDQLIYEFCSPLLGGSFGNPAPHLDAPPPYTVVPFILPTYSPLNPMGGNPQITINPNTGLITGVPTIQGQFVVGICVKEYRNGELLSVVQRDFQFNVTVCELVIQPELDVPKIDNTFVLNSCADPTVGIVNLSEDQDFIEVYYWEFEIPGSPPLIFDTRDVMPAFPGLGTYFGKMILNPGEECSDSAEIQVNILPPVVADFESEYDSCKVAPVSFVDLSQGGRGPLTDWDWSFEEGGISEEQNPSYQYQASGTKTVQLIVTDSLGCQDSIAYLLGWFPAPNIILIEPDALLGCHPQEISFNNLSSPVDNSYDFLWDFGDGGFSTDMNPVHVYEFPGLYNVSIEITSPHGCFESELWNNLIHVTATPRADFSYSPTEICSFDPKVELTNLSADEVRWHWYFDDQGYTEIESPEYIFADTGLQQITLIVENEIGCKDSVTRVLDIVPKVTYYLPNAFTPNNDDLNDSFKGKGVFEGMRDFKLFIRNRWGELIFETSDPELGWNGQKNNSGKLAPSGVYIYLVNYTGSRGEELKLKGFATLVR